MHNHVTTSSYAYLPRVIEYGLSQIGRFITILEPGLLAVDFRYLYGSLSIFIPTA